MGKVTKGLRAVARLVKRVFVGRNDSDPSQPLYYRDTRNRTPWGPSEQTPDWEHKDLGI